MKDWLIEEDWKNVTEAKTSNEKAETFQNILRNRFNLCFPKKQIKVSNDDQPWFSQKIQKLEYIINTGGQLSIKRWTNNLKKKLKWPNRIFTRKWCQI